MVESGLEPRASPQSPPLQATLREQEGAGRRPDASGRSGREHFKEQEALGSDGAELSGTKSERQPWIWV